MADNQNQFHANDLIYRILGNFNDSVRNQMLQVLNGSLTTNNQQQSSLCWACTTATCVKSVILDKYSYNLSTEYIFKLLIVGKLNDLLANMDPSVIQTTDLVGEPNDAMRYLNRFPVHDSEGNVITTLQVTSASSIDLNVTKSHLLAGIRVSAYLSYPVHSSNHAVTVIGHRRGRFKYVNSYQENKDVITVEENKIGRNCQHYIYNVSTWRINNRRQVNRRLQQYYRGFGSDDTKGEIHEEGDDLDVSISDIQSESDKDIKEKDSSIKSESTIIEEKETKLEEFSCDLEEEDDTKIEETELFKAGVKQMKRVGKLKMDNNYLYDVVSFDKEQCEKIFKSILDGKPITSNRYTIVRSHIRRLNG
jgi:hypothetical protein